MLHDRYCGRRALDRATLYAIARIRTRFLRCRLAHANTLNAYAKTRSIHHDKHVLKAAIFLTNQRTDGTGTHLTLLVAKQQYRSRAAVNP